MHKRMSNWVYSCIMLGVAVAAMALGGCDVTAMLSTPTPVPTGTPTPVPDTAYDSDFFHVSARLPGRDWQPPQRLDIDDPVSDLVMSLDRDQILTVSTSSRYIPKNLLDIHTFVASFAETAYSPPQHITDEDFHGYQAVRLEATWTKSGLPYDYHIVQYFFVARSQLYFVGAGTNVPDWDSGGKEVVTEILDSVRFR